MDTNSPASVPSITSLLQFASITLLGVVSYFLKRAISDVDDLANKVGELRTSVAVLLDRDRRKRHEDYDRERDSWNNEGGSG